jgi:hypothetical protein
MKKLSDNYENLKVYGSVQKNTLLVPILSYEPSPQTHILLFKIHFNIIFPSAPILSWSGVGLLSTQAWMPAYSSILRSPRQSLDLIRNSCFSYQV